MITAIVMESKLKKFNDVGNTSHSTSSVLAKENRKSLYVTYSTSVHLQIWTNIYACGEVLSTKASFHTVHINP